MGPAELKAAYARKARAWLLVACMGAFVAFVALLL